jgi:SAM-dependent methyltransferase
LLRQTDQENRIYDNDQTKTAFIEYSDKVVRLCAVILTHHKNLQVLRFRAASILPSIILKSHIFVKERNNIFIRSNSDVIKQKGVEMEKMKMEDILAYQINKNIFFEGIENSRPAGYLRWVYRYFEDYFVKKTKPVFSARLIEYPLVFQYLDRQSKSILDFGCAEDVLSIHLALMGHKVTGMDFRKFPFEHKNFSFIQADILTWEPPAEKYDTVVSISTIEHVGLSAYGDPKCKDGDAVAVQKLWSALRKGGDFIMTVPAGKPIEKLFPKVDTLRFFYKTNRYEMWEETNDEVISKLEYDNYNALYPSLGVVFVVAKKT